MRPRLSGANLVTSQLSRGKPSRRMTLRWAMPAEVSGGTTEMESGSRAASSSSDTTWAVGSGVSAGASVGAAEGAAVASAVGAAEGAAAGAVVGFRSTATKPIRAARIATASRLPMISRLPPGRSFTAVEREGVERCRLAIVISVLLGRRGGARRGMVQKGRFAAPALFHYEDGIGRRGYSAAIM